METQSKNPQKNISVSAIQVFAVGAAIVYLIALYYCYATQHFFEMKVLGTVMLLVAAFVFFIRRSLVHDGEQHDALLAHQESDVKNKSKAA